MSAKPHGLTTQKAGKVLVINSDPEVIRILEVNLTDANLEFIAARSGTEGLSKINAEKPDIILLDPILPDIDGIEICLKLRESPETSYIPLIILSTKSRKQSRTLKKVADTYLCITKPFNPREIVALIRTYLKRMERTENTNPLTGLPNQTQINNEITALIEQKKTFATIHISLDDLTGLNKTYGYAHGDRTIQLLADIASEAVCLFGDSDDLVGHPGGGKFVVISTPFKARAICRRIIADFSRRVKSLYTSECLERSYASHENPLNTEVHNPNVNLNIIVVTNQKQVFRHYLEVSEAAAEQMDYLKRTSGNRSSFDIRQSYFRPPQTTVRQSISSINREDVKATHGVLAWLDFLAKELDARINILRNSLDAAESDLAGNISPEKNSAIKVIREHISQLGRVVEGLTHLTKAEEFMADAVFEEVDVTDTLKWILEYVRELTEQRNIEIAIEKIENFGRLMVDRRDFTQGLLYIIRSEVLSGPPGSTLYISAAEINEEYISIRIVNPNHFIPQQALEMLLHGQLEAIPHNVLRNELHPARLLLQGIGGKLTIVSAEGEGTNYIVIAPKRWQSWMQEVNALQLATEISRKEARAELANVHYLLSSLVEQVPVKMKDNLENLGSKIQELEVLCNRSLFLADDLNNRLETHQERTQKQEVEQFATSEAMVAIMQDLAGSLRLRHLFDTDSSKKVARYALAMAKELNLPESDCQLLRQAATFKDLGLVSSAYNMVAQMATLTPEEAAAIESRFKPMLAVLATLPFLAPVLNSVQNRYVRYDAAGDSFRGNDNTDVPMAARILAVADTYNSLISGLPAQEKLSPEQARQKIADDSGLRFDPDVVKVFSYLWKRKDLDVANNRRDKLYE